MSQIILPAEERLERFRERTAGIRRQALRDLLVETEQIRGVLPVGGGAPTLQTTLASQYLSTVNNTFTGPQSLIEADARGPFSMDFFHRPGCLFEQEAMGILSSTATPTIVFGTYFGNVSGTITTVLAVNAAITTASAVANADWYYFAIGRTVAASAATSTILVTGYLINNINVLATVATTLVKNATPPTAVTADMSGGAVFIDLKGTWSASSVSNTITTNFYRLSNLMI